MTHEPGQVATTMKANQYETVLTVDGGWGGGGDGEHAGMVVTASKSGVPKRNRTLFVKECAAKVMHAGRALTRCRAAC